MRAARLNQPGEPLTIEQVDEPVPRDGTVVVRVEAAFVAPSAREVLGGQLPFTLPPIPFTPGMDTIGTIEAVGDDVAGLEAGQRVYVDHYYASRSASQSSDGCLIGYFGFTPASARLLARWRDGSYAEKLLIPAECVTALGEATSIDASRLCRLGYLGTAYGGLLRAGFKPADRIIVNGATGVLGVGAVLLALAMGASRVVCVGRKRDVLEELRKLDPRRIVVVQRMEDGEDSGRIVRAARGAEVLIDALGYVDSPRPTLDVLAALRPGGTAVFVGGVQAELPISYRMILGMELTVCGSGWFPRGAAGELLAMIAAGTLDLGSLRPNVFPLEEVNEAVAAAARRPGGFEHVVLEVS